MSSEKIDLVDLVGKRILDAVDFEVEKVERWSGYLEDAQACRFRLDGRVYVALENPDDGYRSMLDTIYVQERADMRNVFSPVEVIGVLRDKSGYRQCDIVEFVDVNTGRVVLEVGTDNTDDYYPSYVASFHPENMVTNQS